MVKVENNDSYFFISSSIANKAHMTNYKLKGSFQVTIKIENKR